MENSNEPKICLHGQAAWINGNANGEDWSNYPYPKQYKREED